jgi:5S rRNA maturation endonuclease (ribonuclease M5)
VQQFYDTLRSELQQKLGCLPKENLENISSGQWFRFGRNGKKPFFLILNRVTDNNSKQYITAKFGDWHTFQSGQNVHSLNSWSKNGTTSAIDEKINNLLKEQQIEADKQAKENEKKALNNWLKIWNKTKAGNHPYLTKKKIPIHHTRLYGNEIIVPMYDRSLEIKAFQRILSNKNNGNDKLMVKYLKATGKFFHLKDFKSSKKVFLTEGFADAATIQMLTDIPVITAFNAGNLTMAIKEIREVNKDCEIVIAGDNDEAGLQAIKKAKKTHHKIKSVLPNHEKDFSDEYLKHGAGSVRESLEDKKKVVIEPRGLDDNGRYYYISSFCSLKSLSFKDHTKNGFLHLVPDLEYWQDNFGELNEKGKMKVDWEAAQVHFMKLSQDKGRFDPEKNRGLGIWFENDEMVINTGDKVVNEQKDSDYFYERGDGFKYEPGDVKEMIDWVEVLSKIQMKEKVGGVYLAAWFVQSFIFPVFDWRFQCWLNAEAASGKTTIMGWLKETMLFQFHTTDSTAAGLRALVRSNQTAVIYDEFEPGNKKSLQVLDLMREASSNDGASTGRGTPGQTGIQFNTQVNFMFSSIQLNNLNAADKTRLLIIDLEKQNCLKLYEKRNNQVKKAKKQKGAFLHYLVSNIETIHQMRSIAIHRLQEKGLGARECKQYGGVISCFGIIYIYQGMSAKHAFDKIMNDFDFTNTEYLEDASTKSEESILEKIGSLIIDRRESRSILELLSVVKNFYSGEGDQIRIQEEERILRDYGIRYFPKKRSIFIHHQNQNLLAMLPEYPGFGRILIKSNIFETKLHTCRLKKGFKPIQGILLDEEIYFGNDL